MIILIGKNSRISKKIFPLIKKNYLHDEKIYALSSSDLLLIENILKTLNKDENLHIFFIFYSKNIYKTMISILKIKNYLNNIENKCFIYDLASYIQLYNFQLLKEYIRLIPYYLIRNIQSFILLYLLRNNKFNFYVLYIGKFINEKDLKNINFNSSINKYELVKVFASLVNKKNYNKITNNSIQKNNIKKIILIRSKFKNYIEDNHLFDKYGLEKFSYIFSNKEIDTFFIK